MENTELPMSTPQEASQHLRAIRQLMEKATVVQALTVRAAWVAGLGTLLVALLPASAGDFRVPWFWLLGIVLLVNFAQLWHSARREGRPFPSPVLSRVVRGMSPSLLVACLLSIFAFQDPRVVVICWVLGNGCGLLAASHLLPRSLSWLGLAFFLAGIVLIGFQIGWFPPVLPSPRLCMVATFGVFHLAYALLCFVKKSTPMAQASLL